MKEVIVRFHEKVWLQQEFFVDKAEGEISWLGIAEDKGIVDGDRVIDITEIFLLEQECSGVITEIDGAAFARLLSSLGDRSDKLLYWGHSHVNMGVAWSGTDDKQIESFKKNVPEFFVSYVFNKKREFNKRVDGFVNGFEFRVNNIKTQIIKKTMTDEIENSAERISNAMDFDIDADNVKSVLRTFLRKIPKEAQYIDTPLTKDEKADLEKQMAEKVKKKPVVQYANTVNRTNYKEKYRNDGLYEASWNGSYGAPVILQGRDDWGGWDREFDGSNFIQDGDKADRGVGQRRGGGAQSPKSVLPNKRGGKKQG